VSAGVLGLVPVRETAPQLLTFTMNSLGRRQLQLVRVAAAISGKVAPTIFARAWRMRPVLMAKKRLEASGRGDWGFISLSPSLTTSVA